MKTNDQRIFITVLLAMVFLLQGNCQSKELQGLVDNEKKLWKTIVTPKGRNEIRNWQIKKGFCTEADYQLPQKVALLSFYIKDDASYAAYSSTYVTTTTKNKASSEKVNAVAQRIYEQLITELKSEFAELGMELLEPSEYLISEELQKIYYQRELPILDKKIKSWGLGGNNSAVPEGYRLIPLNDIQLTGKKYFQERDQLMMDLGMDAYVTIGVNLQAAAEKYIKSSASIDYKNPATGTETIYRPFNENVYSNTKFGQHFKNIWIKEEREIVNKKGKTKTEEVPVDIDPNVALLTRYNTAAAARELKNWIQSKKE